MFPILFRIGPLTIHTYGFFTVLGFSSALFLAMKRARRAGLPPEKIFDLGFYILLAAMIGSKILFVIQEWNVFIENLKDCEGVMDYLKALGGGFAFYGGLIGAFFVGWIYVRRAGLPLWKTGDLLAPSIALGHGIGRLGCFSAGCCYGKPTDLPWGVVFNHPESLAPQGIPLHPTELYSAFGEFAICVITLVMDRRKKFNGQVFWSYVVIYSLFRFFIEYLRGDERLFLFNGLLSIYQVIALVLFPIGIIMLIILAMRKNDTSENA